MLATRNHFTSDEACRLAGVSYRQADYWVRLGLIEPMVQATGSGSRRRFCLEDVVALRVVHLLMRHRLPQETIREVLGSLGADKPLIWIRDGRATSGDAFDFLGEADHLKGDEVVLVFSPAAMLEELHNRG